MTSRLASLAHGKLLRLASRTKGLLVLQASRVAIAVALLVPLVEQAAHGQTSDERDGFFLRELSLSTGYMGVQLPPLTLGGELPDAALEEDLITSGTIGIDWRRVTSRTRYTFELFGAYTARTRYAQLSAPGTDLTLGVSRAVGTRWRLGAGIASAITGSDQLAFQPTQTRRLAEDAATFDDLAGRVAFARSPAPDAAQAELFVPISQSLVGTDLYRNRTLASSVRAEAGYRHSTRLATYFRGSYTIVRPISSNRDPSRVLLSPDSNAEGAGVEVRYDRTERTQVRAGLNWSQTSGASEDQVAIATVGYGWSGRKWFARTTLGAALRPFDPAVDTPLTTSARRTPELVYNGAIGYKFQTQTLIVEYSHAPHDEFGHGGRNVATGFEGNVQSVGGFWAWSSPRSRWNARSDFYAVRRPGNFSYIHAWLATAAIGRQLTPNVSLLGELLFDRHGSRGFEGFYLTREGARVTFIWTPQRRRAEQGPPEQRRDSDR